MVRVSFFLLLVLVAPEAFARAKLAGLAPMEAKSQANCELGYAKLQNRQAKPDLADRVRRRYADFSGITDEDTAAYTKLAQEANAGRTDLAALFLDVENAVLKTLNDRVVQDRELVTALTNLHKDVVWSAISADPVLNQAIVAKYSDFKSLRFAFAEDTPEIRRQASRVFAGFNARYGEYVDKLVAQNGWQERMRGLSANTRHWFHAGLGATPDQAGLASRASRTQIEEGRAAVLRSFTGSSQSLELARGQVGEFQRWVAARFRGVDGFLSSDRVLTAEVIEAIKKAVLREGENSAEAVARALSQRFRIQVNGKEAAALEKYLSLVDQFSPGLLLDNRTRIVMDQPARGVISADFKGQNARNIEATMRALASAEGKPLPDLIREVRLGEKAATDALNEKKADFQRALDRAFPKRNVHAEFSGDDGVAFVNFDLGADDLARFQEVWAGMGKADELRMTMIPLRASSGADSRSAQIVKAESLEKKYRQLLIEDLPREKLNQLQLGVLLDDARATVQVKGNGLSEAERASLERRVKELGVPAQINWGRAGGARSAASVRSLP